MGCRPADEVARYCSYLTACVLAPTDSVPAVGVTYHVIDCWLPELREAAALAPADALAALLEPVAQCAARTPHPACLTRLTCGTSFFVLERAQALRMIGLRAPGRFQGVVTSLSPCLAHGFAQLTGVVNEYAAC